MQNSLSIITVLGSAGVCVGGEDGEEKGRSPSHILRDGLQMRD